MPAFEARLSTGGTVRFESKSSLPKLLEELDRGVWQTIIGTSWRINPRHIVLVEQREENSEQA